MSTTDTPVTSLIANKLPYASWKAAKTGGTLSDTELYEITDINTALQEKLTQAGSASQGIYVDAQGAVQTCDAVTSTYSGTGTAPVNGTAVKSAIDAAISSVYKPAGSVAFANLPSPAASLEGNVYDVTDAFTTDSKFVNSGESYPAGTNVVVINTSGSTYKYDVLAGLVDLTPYQLAETAVTHTKNTAAGSATNPVYIASDGTATATTYTLSKSVPADAVFTDTTYSAFTGADGTDAGSSGLVPAPTATDNVKFLKGDGTWAVPTDTTYNDMTGAGASTAGDHGLVPAPAAGDNTKFLRGDATWATVDALPSQTSQSGKFLTTDGTTASWATVDALPSQTSQSGKFLTTDGSSASWAVVPSTLPTQTGQSGKFLTTDGTDASWANVDALPSQSGQSGKYLTTNGTTASWSTVSASVSYDGDTINENSSNELQAIGVIEKNAGNIKYDWVGTLAQWQAGRTAETIPDSWFCYIIDDESTSIQVSWSAITDIPTAIQAIAAGQGGSLDSGTMGS